MIIAFSVDLMRSGSERLILSSPGVFSTPLLRMDSYG